MSRNTDSCILTSLLVYFSFRSYYISLYLIEFVFFKYNKEKDIIFKIKDIKEIKSF
jgi:hypothetical protein